VYGKTKICDFQLPVPDEHIGRLDIPVHDVPAGEVLQPLKKLARIGPQFFFGEGTAFPEGFFETAAVAELGDEVAVVGAFEDLDAANDVGVVEGADDRDLLLEQLFQLLEGQRGQLDHLHRKGLVWMGRAVPVPSRTAR
jgi:hypothetical protein